MMFASTTTSKALTLLLAVAPLVVTQARVGDQRQLSRDDDRPRSPDQRECVSVPLKIRSNGEGILFDSMFVAAFFDAGSSPILSPPDLCGAYMDAYNNNTDCSALLGSFREIGSCQVLSDAEGPVNSNLLKLEYFANVLDGDEIYGDELTEPCGCNCGSDQQVVIGVFLSSTCNCFCEPQDFDCACVPPTEDFIVKETNDLYANAVPGTSIKFTAMPQIELLDIFDCDVNITTYNETAVCPGMESTAFSDLLTEAPSATPTATPSEFPSEFPSEYPSEFPSEFPTDFPTDSPTQTPV